MVASGAVVGEEQTPPESELEDTEGKNPHAVALGRIGGKKVGKAMAKKLTPERRSEIARQATVARWSRREPNQ